MISSFASSSQYRRKFQRLMICLSLLLMVCSFNCQGWITPTSTTRTNRPQQQRARLVLLQQSSTSSSVNSQIAATTSDDDEDDDDEYEYVEYDALSEDEFLGSEWLVGTVMDNNPNKIQETWCRLAVDNDGKNVAIWGDNSEGTWNWDTANQFLSFSKNSLIGKDIWAGVVDDYYYIQGTVRGWNFLSPAAVLGQWQAKRLGIDPEEAGVAPWFEQNQEEEESSPSLEGTTTENTDEN